MTTAFEIETATPTSLPTAEASPLGGCQYPLLTPDANSEALAAIVVPGEPLRPSECPAITVDPHNLVPALADSVKPTDTDLKADDTRRVSVAEYLLTEAAQEATREISPPFDDREVELETITASLEVDISSLPCDKYGWPYGPTGKEMNANPDYGKAWQYAYERWKDQQADEVIWAVEDRDALVTRTATLLNGYRYNQSVMPNLHKLREEKYQVRYMADIDLILPRLNAAEKKHLEIKDAVPCIDPAYPAKIDCYCTRSGRYWHKVNRKWCAFNKDQYVTQLIAEGYNGGSKKSAPRGSQVSEIARQVSATQIRIAGAWSGHAEGLHKAGNGSLYLCTKDSPIPKLEQGEYAHLWKYLQTLLGEGVDPHYATQKRLFLAWMRHAITALQRRDTECPSRLMVLTGEHGNGKSTLVSKIIHTAFGGRTVSAKLMMSGKTGFNSELAEAELITFDDIPNNLSPLETANTLKTFLVGHELGMLVHPKGQDAATIPVLHRLVWCCNNDVNALRHLPKMRKGDGLIDKVITLLTHKTPVAGMRSDDAKSYRDKLAEQVPAFLHWLMSSEVETALADQPVDGRGPEAWMHPEIEAELLDMSPEQHLAGMLRYCDERGAWDARGNTVQSIDTILSSVYHSRYEKLVGGSPVRLGLMLAALASTGVIQKAPKSPNSNAANRWFLVDIADKLSTDE